MRLENDRCCVSITVDSTYTVESADNLLYDLELNPNHRKHNDRYRTFAVEIDLFYRTIRIALVGDYDSYDDKCAVLDDDVLTILQGSTIVQIKIEDGSLLFYKNLDCFGCNFGMYQVQQGYLIYGEIEITMLDFEFHKNWAFSGRDIFASVSGKKPFTLGDHSIKLYDFEDHFYEIDFHGNLIGEASQPE